MAINQENSARPGDAALEDNALLERASAPTLRDLRLAAGELLALSASSSNTNSNGGEFGERTPTAPPHR